MNRRIMLGGLGAALVLLLVWYFLFWTPRTRDIEAAQDRADQAQLRQDDLLVQLARLRAAKRNEAALRSQIEELRIAIPDQPNLAQFILDTNEAAARSGIDFLSIAPTPPATAGAEEGQVTPDATAPVEIILNMTVSGGYFQVLDFLNRLDALPRLVVVDTLNLGGDGQTLQVSLTGRMFMSQLPAGVAAPGEGAPTTTTTVAGETTTTVPVEGAAPAAAPATTATTVPVP